MPTDINLIAQRQMSLWRICETKHFVVHIHDALDDVTVRMKLMGILDDLHSEICAKLDCHTIQPEESQQKLNLWLYDSVVLKEAGLIQSPSYKMFYGAANSAGVHIVVHQMEWDSVMVIDRIRHENIHAVWSAQVGDAAALLNEGIAVCFECLLAQDRVVRTTDLQTKWLTMNTSKNMGWLRSLCITDAFWSAYDDGAPVYEIGGQLTLFLVETIGIAALKKIFLASHYNDTSLAERLEEAMNMSIESLEQAVSRWSQFAA